MNYKHQILPCPPALRIAACFAGCFLLMVTLTAAETADQQPPASAEPAAAQQASDAAVPALPAADDILNQARTRLESLNSLQCDLQQTAIFGGVKLIAAGKYTEASGNRVHLIYRIYPMSAIRTEDAAKNALDAAAPELKPEENRGELLQVSDGAVVHTSWKNGDIVRVTRRNLKDILDAAQTISGYDPNNVAMDLGVGGLRALISRLQTSMVFAPVKTVQAGDRTLLEVTGRWSDRVRREIFGLPEGTFVDSRPFVPEYVRVYVDQETMLLRRIQFLKHSADPAQKLARPLLTLDLRNLRINDTIDESLFTFTPPENTREEDMTESVINSIKASVAPESAPKADTPAATPPKAPDQAGNPAATGNP
jgi:hypothetical protein